MSSSITNRIDRFLFRAQLFFSWKTSAKNRAKFYSVLARFARDGIPIKESLIELDSRLRAQKDPKGTITSELLRGMRGVDGKFHRLGKGLRAWSPSLECVAIDAGESTGNLETGLRMAIRLSGLATRITKTVKGSLLPPVGLLLLLFALLLLLKEMVIPSLEAAMPRHQWPYITSSLASISENAYLYIYLITGLILFFLVAFKMTKDRYTGRFRLFLDKHVFPWTLHRHVSAAITLNCFAALSRAGVAVEQTIKRLATTASPWEKKHLDAMALRKRLGKSDGEAIGTELFDDETKWFIDVYARRTSFSEALDELSNDVAESTIEKIQSVCSAINWAVKISIAGVAIWMMSGMAAFTLALRATIG